jgi:hypothetical protein
LNLKLLRLPELHVVLPDRKAMNPCELIKCSKPKRAARGFGRLHAGLTLSRNATAGWASQLH